MKIWNFGHKAIVNTLCVWYIIFRSNTEHYRIERYEVRNMIESIKGYKLIKFNTGNDRYLLKGKGLCKEFESRKAAIEYLEFWISLD